MKYNCKHILSVLLVVCVLFSSIVGAHSVYAVGIDGCTCGTDNETHASDCALMAEEQDTEETCTCTPVDGVHQEGCALYAAPDAENEQDTEATCTCTPTDGVHQEGCALYAAPDAENEQDTEATCSCTPVDGVHQEGCALYAAPDAENEQDTEETCTCTPVDGVHQEGCALYAAPDAENEQDTEDGCTCTPVDGVHQEGCSLYYIMPINETENEIVFSVGMYEDADRTKTAAELTESGATMEGWPFVRSTLRPEDRYLGISLDNLDMEKQYQIVVAMQPVLYFNQTGSLTALTNTTIVSEVKNASIPVNAGGSYKPNQYSFSNLTYLINKGTQSMSAGMPLRFDTTLWNKKDGAGLGDGTTPLLEVTLQEVAADGTVTTVKELKLLNATVSGSLPFVAGVGYYLQNASSTTSDTIASDDTVRTAFDHYTNGENLRHYTNDVKVEITIPTCTVGEKVYSLPYQDFKFYTTDGALPITLTEEMYSAETNVLTVTAEQLCFADNNTFAIVFSAPADFPEQAGIYTFTGNIKVTLDGENIERSIAIKLDTRNAAVIKAIATAKGQANIKETDVVQPLGGLALKNTGTGHSTPLRVDLEFETKVLSVTTVNLMCDRATEKITIWYSLVDRKGDPAFPDENGVNRVFEMEIDNPRYNVGTITTLTDQDYKTLTRAELPVEEHRAYYFETLSYTIGMIPANSSAYHTGATLAPYSAGTIWGYVNVTEIPETLPKHYLTVYQLPAEEEGETVKLGAASVTTGIDAGTSVSYGLVGGVMSPSSITAGDSFKISGQVATIRYPYSSNSCLNNIRLGVVLPAGATLNVASISATYENGTQLAVQSVTQNPIEGSTNVLNIIAFQEGQKFGYFSETLYGLENGTTLDFSFLVNTEKTMSSQPITLLDHVFVAGDQLKNAAGGTFSGNAAKDIYDLNNNGSTTDNIGCFSIKGTTAQVTVQASPAELAITDSLTDKNGNTGTSLNMETFADVFTYKLQVECTAGGSASEFYYMIPIAKTNMKTDSDFVKNCQVSLELKDAVTVTTSQGTAMKVLYSTAPISQYSDSLDLEDWSETIPDGKTWQDVTVIKVIASEDEIENGSINVISVPMGLYDYEDLDTEYKHMAGYQIQWCSRGYYHYKVGYNSNSGTKSTAGATVTLTYTPQETISFTLTAAKDGKPSDGQNTYELDLQVLFYLAQEYRVKQVTPYNVNLMGADYDFAKASSAEANENFRIKISVKNRQETESQQPIALQKDNDIIGTLDANSIPVFTFSIENANALSDIVTERKVTLTLIGSNGVIVPVEITIKRELAAAEPTTSAIVAGELYAPFDGSTSATVSCDSAFTAQFVTKEIVPSNYTGHTIVFDSAPVSGTTIRLIDWTDPTSLKFYSYTLNGSTNKVKLTEFHVMGSSAKYTESQNINVVIERLLFIVSFPEVGESARENSMKLTKQLKTGENTTEESDALKFNTVAKRGFSLSSVEDPVDCGKTFKVSYTSDCSVTDSRYTNRNLSLVIRPSQGSFPVHSCLTVDGTTYSLNAQGSFIVPLKAVQTGNGTVAMSFDMQSSESVSLQILLRASATANGSKPLMGSVVAGPISVSVNANSAPSLKVNSMSARVLEAEDLSNVLTVDFEKKNAETVTIELQKKIGAAYVTQTTILESVDGKTSADAGQGIFMISGNSVEIKLSSSTDVGTYRLLFTASGATDTITVPYNFVVVE